MAFSQPDPNWYKDIFDSKDHLGLVLRTQMKIESAIDEILSALVVFPDLIDKMHLDYHNKVQLAVVLGVDPKMQPALNYFGSLRNRFAHRPNQVILKGDSKNLYKLLPDWLARMVHDHHIETHHQIYPDGDYKKFNELPPVQQYLEIFVCVDSTLRKYHEMALNGDLTYIEG